MFLVLRMGSRVSCNRLEGAETNQKRFGAWETLLVGNTLQRHTALCKRNASDQYRVNHEVEREKVWSLAFGEVFSPTSVVSAILPGEGLNGMKPPSSDLKN